MGLFLLAASLVFCLFITSSLEQTCKCGPEDSCWPTKLEWDGLNRTVDGRLIKTVPIGAICRHSFENVSYYDAEGCAKVKEKWTQPDPHLPSSSSLMNQIFTNASCDPFDDPTAPCRVDDYVSYTINVTKRNDVLAGLNFVQDYNIRLVIRNTGHDNLGRSTGHAALGIWVHHMTDIDYDPHYQSRGYNGPAVRVGAGVSSGELVAKLNSYGQVAVGGACSSVGVAGGHTPGGGHSVLSSLYGLGADNTLEFEVIAANGTLVTASPAENPDLYWALSGGGSGNYGIVWSMTVRTFPDMTMATASLNFTSTNITSDHFWEAIGTWNSLTPKITQEGAWAYVDIVSVSPSLTIFSLNSLIGPNFTVSQVNDLIAPLRQKLTTLKIPYQYNTFHSNSYYEAYSEALPAWPVGSTIGSRLISRETIEQKGDELIDIQKTITKLGMTSAEIVFKADQPAGTEHANSVLPAWRNTNMHIIAGYSQDNGIKNYPLMLEQQSNITNIILPALHKLIPDSGAYINEGDVFDPNWKVNFYGDNYNRLLQVKQKWDPNNVFWVPVGVGSDALSKNAKQLLCTSAS